MRHLADVVALKGDPPAQQQLLIDGLSRLFGTTLGWLFAFDDARHGRRIKPVLAVLEQHLDPVWVRYMGEFAVRVPPASDMYADHLLRCPDPVQQWTRPRVLPDRAAERRYAACMEVVHAARLGDGAVCAFRTGPSGDRAIGFSLHRADRDPRMTERDYALHRLALREIRGLHARGHLALDARPPHARPPAPDGLAALSPRLRQTLDRLLAGDAVKQVATHLNLSHHTVKDYVKALYAHFGVCSRGELLARFIHAR